MPGFYLLNDNIPSEYDKSDVSVVEVSSGRLLLFEWEGYGKGRAFA